VTTVILALYNRIAVDAAFNLPDTMERRRL